MNRRDFLKGLGALAIALQGGVAVARQHIPFVDPRTWQEKLPFPTTLEELGPAIERLFPGPVLESVRAYKEYIPGTLRRVPERGIDYIPGFGMATIKAEGGEIPYDSFYDGPVTRCVPQTFALDYVLSGNIVTDERRDRMVIRLLYQTMLMYAMKPENNGATLIWRKRPEVSIMAAFNPDEPDELGMIGKVKSVARMRLSLKPNGWRERIEIKPVLWANPLEGEMTRMLA